MKGLWGLFGLIKSFVLCRSWCWKVLFWGMEGLVVAGVEVRSELGRKDWRLLFLASFHYLIRLMLSFIRNSWFIQGQLMIIPQVYS